MKENLINYGYKTADDEYEREYQNIKGDEKNSVSKGKFYYTGSSLLLILQICVCIFIILFVLLLKNFSDPLYQQFKSWYIEKVNDSLIIGETADDYIDTINNIVSGDYKSTLFDSISQNRQTTKGISNVPVTLTIAPTKPLLQGKITSEFGEREDPLVNKEYDIHYGIDIAAEENQEIYSVFSGKIQIAEESSSYGNYILVDHGNDIKTLYAHCNELLKKEGDKVKQGEKIALVGSTGESTGNHLHLELIISNERYDPEPILKGIYI